MKRRKEIILSLALLCMTFSMQAGKPRQPRMGAYLMVYHKDADHSLHMALSCDTVVYDRQLRPRMIVEYKRTNVSLTQKVFDQISRYNRVMRVDWLVVSNGLEHYCCCMDYEQQTYAFVREIPTFDEVVGEKPEDASTNKCEKLP